MCIRECISSHLWKAEDKDSLQALMQTSRELCLIISSMIHTVKIVDTCDSVHEAFPRHATIRSLRLGISALAKTVAWIRAYAASSPKASDRLLLLESLEFDLKSLGIVPGDVAALLDAMSQLCPNVRRLNVHPRREREVDLALLRSLGRTFPHLTELSLGRCWFDFFPLQDSFIDWSACIPPKLTKLSMPESKLPRKLIQHLVQMPSLVEVDACSLDDQTNGGPIETEACAWKVLRCVSICSIARL